MKSPKSWKNKYVFTCSTKIISVNHIFESEICCDIEVSEQISGKLCFVENVHTTFVIMQDWYLLHLQHFQNKYLENAKLLFL